MNDTPKFCENCGAPLGQDINFCEACGHPIKKLPAQAEEDLQQFEQKDEERQRKESQRKEKEIEEPGPRLEKEEKSSGGRKWFIGVILLFAVLALGWYGTQDSTTPVTTTKETPPAAAIVTSLSEQKTIINSIGMDFVLIPAGEFNMGSLAGEKYRILEELYWFSWDEIPGNANLELIDYLKYENDWVTSARIEKIDNGRIIKVSFENHYLLLSLNNEKTKVNLKIDDVQTDEFIAKTENGKLNIYIEIKPYDTEDPVHRVKISKAFYMGKYEVTQKQWRDVMGTNPSFFKGDKLPVEKISWIETQEFIKKLNEKEGANKYRLPSEAEWEYAARAGTTSEYYFGDDESNLDDNVWYENNSRSKTHDVGQKKSNPWGVFDMQGNVGEWVQDIYQINYTGSPSDGSAWESGIDTLSLLRVYRGCSWRHPAECCRSAFRGNSYPGDHLEFIGFRLLRDT